MKIKSMFLMILVLVTSLLGQEETVVLKPFMVRGEWMDYILTYNQDQTVRTMRVTNVTRGSPFDSAGIKKGAFILTMQGVKVFGLTEQDFNSKVMGAPLGAKIEMKVVDAPGMKSRDVIIPIKPKPTRAPASNTSVASR